MTPALILWDIDQTLVNTDRAGERALLQIIRDNYQHDFQDQLPVDLRGRTDTSILRDLLAHIKVEHTPQAAEKFRHEYLALLPIMLPQGNARVLPGIRAALDAIAAHPELHQALLTGNLQEGARLKLSHLGLWHDFEFGAYADDSSDRNKLGPVALQRAKEKLGLTFPPKRVFIIGDTPHDIACAQAIGANSIGVATGSFTAEELKACGATHVFQDLSDTVALLKILSV
jgi:phosphoglycolate phosphatase